MVNTIVRKAVRTGGSGVRASISLSNSRVDVPLGSGRTTTDAVGGRDLVPKVDELLHEDPSELCPGSLPASISPTRGRPAGRHFEAEDRRDEGGAVGVGAEGRSER